MKLLNASEKIFLIIGITVIISLYGCVNGNSVGELGSSHIHAGIKVYILGNAVDFSLPKYQLQAKEVHFEDWDGDLVHIHATGITLGYIFRTLRINIDDNCLTLDTGKKYCTNENSELKVFVKNTNSDWSQIFSPADYFVQGLDKILINYGHENEEEIKKYMEIVTSKSELPPPN